MHVGLISLILGSPELIDAGYRISQSLHFRLFGQPPTVEQRISEKIGHFGLQSSEQGSESRGSEGCAQAEILVSVAQSAVDLIQLSVLKFEYFIVLKG